MSSELHEYIEASINKKESILNAEVINFPNNKDINNSQVNNSEFWNLKDKSNIDQLRAVTGICFMFIALILMGVYSNFV
tara:strand:- start:258 stop:494 length:237 start_codon:yes stop_codon:yes gene_type:complete